MLGDDVRAHRQRIIERMDKVVSDLRPLGAPKWLATLLTTPVFIGAMLYQLGIAIIIALSGVIKHLLVATVFPFYALYTWVDSVLITFWYLGRVAQRMSEKKQ